MKAPRYAIIPEQAIILPNRYYYYSEKNFYLYVQAIFSPFKPKISFLALFNWLSHVFT